MNQQTREVLNDIDIEHLCDRLEGRDTKLRPSKPTASSDTGLTQYIWRKAIFHSGKKTNIPVTSHFWLQTYLDDNNIDASVSGTLDDAGKEITDALDEVVKEVLNQKGLSDKGAANRWEGLL